VSNSFKLCPTHFSRGAKKNLGGFCLRGYGPGEMYTSVTVTWTGVHFAHDIPRTILRTQ